jgi:hypothetical protein
MCTSRAYRETAGTSHEDVVIIRAAVEHGAPPPQGQGQPKFLIPREIGRAQLRAYYYRVNNKATQSR